MKTIILVCDEMGNKHDGVLQIGGHTAAITHGQCEIEVEPGDYLIRPIVSGLRGKTERVTIKGNDTITMYVTRG